MIANSDLNDPDINQHAENSSIKRLTAARAPDVSFDDLVRGDSSLGFQLVEEGVDSIPSPTNRGPGTSKYLAGKNSYTTKTYKDQIDVVQIEIPYMFRNSSSARQEFAQKLASAVADFYQDHYGMHDANTPMQYTALLHHL